MSRIAALQQLLEDEGVDALVVTARSNIRYLSGFSGSAGTLVVGAAGATLVTDNRYALQAPDEIARHGAPVEVRIGPSGGFPDVVDLVKTAPVVGLESDHITWGQAARFATALPGDTTSTSGLIEGLRERKDDAEIALIESAAGLADAALADVRDLLANEPTERAFATELEAAMRRRGADRAGFETIVAAGANSARPHHRPGDTPVRPGDLVVVDFGAETGGYRSDMTRSFVVGTPNDRQAELLDGVLAAQAAGVAAAGPGVPTAEIDAACRDHLTSIGLGEWFSHGTGHGVGLDIHEAPSVSASATATLAPGHIITVEPGVYLPEVGGVRWEDTLVITDDGARALTKAEKRPIVDLHTA